jgi:hypothetical protein
MKRVLENFAIAICGFITSVLVAIANVAIARFTGFDFFTLSFWVVIPAGALLVGIAAASGYYFGSLFFHKQPTIFLLFQMVLIAGFSQLLIYWLSFETLYLTDGRKASDFVTFYEYLDIYLTKSHYRFGRSQIDAGESGSFGYMMAALQFLGFLAGGFAIYFILKSKTVCDKCKYYMRTIRRKDKTFVDADSGAMYFDNLFTHPVDGPEFAKLVQTESKVSKPQKGALAVRTALLGCSNCNDQMVEEKVQVFNGSDWKEIDSLNRRVKIPTGVDLAPVFRA